VREKKKREREREREKVRESGMETNERKKIARKPSR
jgi:hypothetical protein